MGTDSVCYNVLYCSQLYRQKKIKPWKDGYLVYFLDKRVAVLYEESYRKLESFHVPMYVTMEIGIQLDFDRHLCLIDAISDMDSLSFPGLSRFHNKDIKDKDTLVNRRKDKLYELNNLNNNNDFSNTMITKNKLPKMKSVINKNKLPSLLKKQPIQNDNHNTINNKSRTLLSDSIIKNAISNLKPSFFDENQNQKQNNINPAYKGTGDNFIPIFSNTINENKIEEDNNNNNKNNKNNKYEDEDVVDDIKNNSLNLDNNENISIIQNHSKLFSSIINENNNNNQINNLDTKNYNYNNKNMDIINNKSMDNIHQSMNKGIFSAFSESSSDDSSNYSD